MRVEFYRVALYGIKGHQRVQGRGETKSFIYEGLMSVIGMIFQILILRVFDTC